MHRLLVLLLSLCLLSFGGCKLSLDKVQKKAVEQAEIDHDCESEDIEVLKRKKTSDGDVYFRMNVCKKIRRYKCTCT